MRQKKSFSFINLILLAFCATLAADPVHLRTNSLPSPIGIDTTRPAFSWQSNSKRMNWRQSGYQVLVATDEKLLRSGHADAWDSGRVTSDESLQVRYAGKPLRSQQRYVWAVRVWDDRGQPSPWVRSSFEMGLLSALDWKAGWIMRKDPATESEIASVRWIWLPGVDPEHVPAGTPARFLYRLRLEDKPQVASLHMLATGQVIARVNGQVTGRHENWSAFDREEITGLLHPGDNEIELDCVSRKGQLPATTSYAAIAASIHVTDAHGRERRVVTDSTWLARSASEDTWAPVQVVGPLSSKYGTDVDGQRIHGPDRVAAEASLFRKEFIVTGAVTSARLSITAFGAYVAYVNGHPVAPDTLLAPGFTDFRKRVEFRTYDVSALLSKGPNTLAAMLGGGWYSSPLTWAGARITPGPNLLFAQLDLTLSDGTHQSIATDESWLTAPSPITFSEIYGGESFDARLEQKGWTTVGFTAAGWTRAAAGSPPNPNVALTAQPDLPIGNTLIVKPMSIAPATAAHPAVFDLGQNMVGNIRLYVHGARGTVIKMRFAERLNPDGSIYTENLRNADATDTYTLSGEGDETYTPAFTFHGFRYVELSGISAPTLDTIEGLVFNSLPPSPSVRLSSSSATLNKMNELGAWGQRGNFVSIPTDCPQRDERLGWMGDAGAFWRTGTFNFDIDAFSHKFMLDVEDAQTPAGEFTDVSPNVLGAAWTGAPGWGDAGIFIPYATWLQYGDTSIVEQAWPAMERWMANILMHNPNYLRRQSLGHNWADWLAPDPNTPKDLIDTAYWALVAKDMAEMAKAIHRDGDAQKYQALYDHIAAAYRVAYIQEDGTVSGNTQTSYLATLFTGIAPENARAAMVERIVSDIAAHGNHLTTGFLGTPFLLPVLDQFDRSDVAFKLLLSDTYPSWGYMVKKGATTWWERWNGDTGDPSMNSYNHYAFGSVMAWVYRRAAGIDTDGSGPGYRHLTIQPHFDAALPQLHVEYDSAYGTIVSDWQQQNRTFTITLPANTTASVSLPDGSAYDVGSGTHRYRIK